MAEKEIKAKNGKFAFPGKGKHASRMFEIDLGDNDINKFMVVEKDMPANLPTQKADDPNFKYDWFTCFGIRKLKDNGQQGDFADITYTVTLDPLPEGKQLFAFYGGQVHSLSYRSTGNKIRATLNVGDPPIGMGP